VARKDPPFQHEQLISREREIEHLQLLLAKLHRMQFGRKSEKLQRQIEQLELRLVRGELVETVAQIGDHGGDSLRPLPLGRAAALYRRWTHRDRQ
jgi:hypothetical protein